MEQFEKKMEQTVSAEKTPSEDRLVMLCDGIFAIAITLLVLNIGIKLPAGITNPTSGRINYELRKMIPPTISYLVTFLILAMYWRIHRNLMHVVKRLDNGFIWLTFLFLAFIAFFPVTSNLLGNYAEDPSVVIIYTLGLSGCAFSACALWVYATWKHRLVDLSLPAADIHTHTYTLLLAPLIYCSSLLLIPVVPQPYYICFSWVLIGFVHRIVRGIYKRWFEKPLQGLLHHEHSQDSPYL